jgi:V8-like Glu-specific endopeptidase
MLIRPHQGRRIKGRVASTLLALTTVVTLAAGCASRGVIGESSSSNDSGKDFVGSVLSPTGKPSAGNGTRQGHDGGLTGQRSLPSFDNAPLPQPVAAHQLPGPYTTRTGAVTGKLFFYRKGDSTSGNYYVCSGTVIKSQNRSLVWTAGHCVHDGKGGTWHLDMVFVPAFDNADGDPNVDPSDLSSYAPLGTFNAVHVWTSPEWVKTGDEHGGDLAHDYAVIEVGRNDNGQTLDDAVASAGAQPVPVWFNAPTSQAKTPQMAIRGYPAAEPFNGMAQWGCTDNAVQLLNVTELGPDAKEYRAGCDLTGGASGGGWFAHAPGQPANEVSLVTNTSVGSAHNAHGGNWLAGPYLDASAKQLFTIANGSPTP